MKNKKITLGILGGGQLAMFSAIAAKKYDIKTIIYSDSNDSPAFKYADEYFLNDYNDLKQLELFARKLDFISYEFENIPAKSLDYLSNIQKINPNIDILRISQNRLREKNFINNLGIKTAAFYQLNSLVELEQYAAEFAYAAIIKTTEFGYDGKGQYKINQDTDLAKLWSENNLANKDLIIEKKINFLKEFSLIVGRDFKGNIEFFPVVENIHNNGILATTMAPADISAKLSQEIEIIAEKIAISLNLIGILAIEFFFDENDNILVNEMAPRPHNSGHYSLDACNISQFEQFVKTVTEQKISPVKLERKAIMHNLIGSEINSRRSDYNKKNSIFYNYGKKAIKPGRKMGHYTEIN